MIVLFLPAALCHFPSDIEIEKLLQSLSIEEKVGQMSQLSINSIIDPSTNSPIEELAVRSINVYRIGSFCDT
jgi:hypothetical protein